MITDIFTVPHDCEQMIGMLKERKPFTEYTGEFKKKDGAVIRVSGNIRLIAGQDDQPDMIEGFLRDVTARVQAEAALHKEIETAQRYLDVAGVMLVVIQADHTVSLINKMGCDILGYSEEAIVGQKWFENFVPKTMKKDMGRVFDQMVQGQAAFQEHQEYPLITRSREERLIYWHHFLLRDELGRRRDGAAQSRV
jgi:PAS domain S-box-containing protein